LLKIRLLGVSLQTEKYPNFMQKKIANILFSTRLMGFLFITYFIAMIVGTFLDRGQETSPTPYSRYWVYNSWWFTAIHIFLVINFIGKCWDYPLY